MTEHPIGKLGIHTHCPVYIVVGDYIVTNGIVITEYNAMQPDQVSKTETMARGTEVLFVATSDCLPSHRTKRATAPASCFLIGLWLPLKATKNICKLIVDLLAIYYINYYINYYNL